MYKEQNFAHQQFTILDISWCHKKIAWWFVTGAI